MRNRFSIPLAGALAFVATPTFAADLATPASNVHNWTGFYVGANAGFGWSHGVGLYANAPFTIANPTVTNPTGGFGGITLGANQQMGGGLVLGVEGDIDYGDVTATIPDKLVPGDMITSTSNWSGAARGRVGFAAGSFMPYLTGGLAVADSAISANGGSVSATLYGWTGGGGVEMALGGKWSAKVEYLYTNFGSHNWFAGQPQASTSTTTSNTLRVGVNYGF